VVHELLRPAHFFHAPTLVLDWQHIDREEMYWEIFQGRLLDPAHTRQCRAFESWNVHAQDETGRSGELLLSVKLDREAGQLHVVRGLECYAWEGYAEGNVILSRERRKWVRELVGTIDLARFGDAAELCDELACLLFHAVVGTSRLPLHSVESPLPAFAFGGLFYCYRSGAGVADSSLTSWRHLAIHVLPEPLSEPERIKALEATLRALPAAELHEAAKELIQRFGAGDALLDRLHAMFNAVSLSPWTDFVAKTLALVQALEERGRLSPEQGFDFLGRLLRQTGRHLTAYDLETFHFRGANYPDALLLDAVLKAYLTRIEARPALVSDRANDTADAARVKRQRRRALRQAWLLRRQYEGHPVPDLPTSPGENARVLPSSHPRVPEEQLLQMARRTRKLYAGDPLPDRPGGVIDEALRQSTADLDHPNELRELGLGLFIDRPLGMHKAPAEPDTTLLLAATAFSRSIAEQRLRFLAGELGLLTAGTLSELQKRLDAAPVRGLPLDRIGVSPRPGVMSLSLARQAAADFVFLHTTRGGVTAFVDQFDPGALAVQADVAFLTGGQPVLFTLAPAGPALRVYDAEWRPRLELEVPREGYTNRAGQEFPAKGLLVVRSWDKDGTMRPLGPTPVRLPPR
jgi:hypothetical protein